eukprot:72938_1
MAEINNEVDTFLKHRKHKNLDQYRAVFMKHGWNDLNKLKELGQLKPFLLSIGVSKTDTQTIINDLFPWSTYVNKGHILKAGETLSPGEYLQSRDGSLTLIMYKHGTLTLCERLYRTQTLRHVMRKYGLLQFINLWSKPIWNPTQEDSFKLVMQTDGNVCLKGYDGRVIWDTWHSESVSDVKDSRCTLVLETNGLYLYLSSGKCVWHKLQHNLYANPKPV